MSRAPAYRLACQSVLDVTKQTGTIGSILRVTDAICINDAMIDLRQDDWQTIQSDIIPLWIGGHIDAAKQLKKPLVLEEFGKVRRLRNRITSVMR
jgi:hypothetical protein